MEDESEPFGEVAGAVRVELPIDDDWRRACKARLKEMRQTQGDLAAHVKCSQGNVSQALNPVVAQQTSEFARAISLALGVELPVDAQLVLVASHLRLGGANDTVAHLLRTMQAATGIALPVVPPRSCF